eukprot:GHVU01188147.1.p1 GENE.GHVU01188147.1~~GHVU01188147.1.p1  ORF type:complete len:212 (+),score=17.39 GHVU01188147.1:63-698(+)
MVCPVLSNRGTPVVHRKRDQNLFMKHVYTEGVEDKVVDHASVKQECWKVIDRICGQLDLGKRNALIAEFEAFHERVDEFDGDCSKMLLEFGLLRARIDQCGAEQMCPPHRQAAALMKALPESIRSKLGMHLCEKLNDPVEIEKLLRRWMTATGARLGLTSAGILHGFAPQTSDVQWCASREECKALRSLRSVEARDTGGIPGYRQRLQHLR